MENNKIKIGADEIILWIRKNGIATNVPNDGINGLGRKIYDIIVGDLQGSKVEESASSYWDETDSSVDQYGLPKTSAQYEIDINKLGELYSKIRTIE